MQNSTYKYLLIAIEQLKALNTVEAKICLENIKNDVLTYSGHTDEDKKIILAALDK